MSVSDLRDAASARVRVSSLRDAARDIGMSPNGLRKFLDGAEPYAPTLRKLRAWYYRRAAWVTLPPAIAAVELLLADLAPSEFGQAQRILVDGLLKAYGIAQRELPAWLTELRNRSR